MQCELRWGSVVKLQCVRDCSGAVHTRLSQDHLHSSGRCIRNRAMRTFTAVERCIRNRPPIQKRRYSAYATVSRFCRGRNSGGAVRTRLHLHRRGESEMNFVHSASHSANSQNSDLWLRSATDLLLTSNRNSVANHHMTGIQRNGMGNR
jgi:hypothetical protein